MAIGVLDGDREKKKRGGEGPNGFGILGSHPKSKIQLIHLL